MEAWETRASNAVNLRGQKVPASLHTLQKEVQLKMSTEEKVADVNKQAGNMGEYLL